MIHPVITYIPIQCTFKAEDICYYINDSVCLFVNANQITFDSKKNSAKVFPKKLHKGPFIYYVSTCKGGYKMAIFAYFQYIKHAYIRGRGGSKKAKKAKKARNVLT